MENFKINDYCGSSFEITQHADGSLFFEISFRGEKQTFCIEDSDIVPMINHIQFKRELPTYKEIGEAVRDELLKDIPRGSIKGDPDRYRYKIGQYILNVDIEKIVSEMLITPSSK